MNHTTLPQQLLDSIELPSYELHTRPTTGNDRKLNVFYGSRLIGYVYVTYIQGQSYSEEMRLGLSGNEGNPLNTDRVWLRDSTQPIRMAMVHQFWTIRPDSFSCITP